MNQQQDHMAFIFGCVSLIVLSWTLGLALFMTMKGAQ